MKKIIFVCLLAGALSLAGCGRGEDPSGISEAPESQGEISLGEQDVPQTEEPADDAPQVEDPQLMDPLSGLEENEYEGLEISAAVLERKAILPGQAVPVSVSVTNKGEETIVYVQGSGSSVTPQALTLQAEGLQAVLPKDQLGMMTMDFVTKELKPGEGLEFTLYVMTVEPNGDFDGYTYELYNSEEPVYIAEMEWETLQELYPELMAAKAGSYPVRVAFRYYVLQEGETNLMMEPTGYNTAELTIGVTE